MDYPRDDSAFGLGIAGVWCVNVCIYLIYVYIYIYTHIIYIYI